MAFDYNSPAELFIPKRKGIGGRANADRLPPVRDCCGGYPLRSRGVYRRQNTRRLDAGRRSLVIAGGELRAYQ